MDLLHAMCPGNNNSITDTIKRTIGGPVYRASNIAANGVPVNTADRTASNSFAVGRSDIASFHGCAVLPTDPLDGNHVDGIDKRYGQLCVDNHHHRRSIFVAVLVGAVRRWARLSRRGLGILFASNVRAVRNALPIRRGLYRRVIPRRPLHYQKPRSGHSHLRPNRAWRGVDILCQTSPRECCALRRARLHGREHAPPSSRVVRRVRVHLRPRHSLHRLLLPGH